jgi:aryl-alcohol dehydrogenase-like predicted oxidoreductase
MHAWDELTPVEEVMRAFDDFVRAGKVLYIGVSDAPAWWVARANTLAELRGWTRFVGLQIEYNLIERTPERELLPMAEALGLTVTPWSPLASGWLTGKYTGKSKEEKRLDKTPQFARRTEQNIAIAKEVVKVAKAAGKSAAQVALNWLRARNNTIPIIGARKLNQIKDNLDCVKWSLNPKQLMKLNEVSAIELGFPKDFLDKPLVRDYLHGGLFNRIKQ